MLSAREIMSGSGPEDFLVAQPLAGGGSGAAGAGGVPLLTSGPGWEVVRRAPPAAGAPLTYPDEADFLRHLRTVESFSAAAGAAGAAVRDLDHARNACAKPRFSLEMCSRDRRAHQCVRGRGGGRGGERAPARGRGGAAPRAAPRC